jgi:predicted nucleic acid-binding protein
MVVVSDTTTISNLFLIDMLWLLEKLYHNVVIPSSVFDELKKLESGNRKIDKIAQAEWIKIMEVNNSDFVSILLLTLDKGEAEAIVLAKEINADLLIIDEVKGRKYAKQLNLNVIGLIGILLLAKQKMLIKSVREILYELKEKSGFWISEKLFNATIELANEK